ncbi:hypothetical protein HPB50_002591 [Hyalomma asiaticum]|uniref:Uncharacterized protein n=1 Tax=Hyalomma asiaticum TaxID=266040 RepID=A0ACB7SDR3_HYAAI|nr:hypothetical protein HPB50_002591 [Hyalomma asiaticum]
MQQRTVAKHVVCCRQKTAASSASGGGGGLGKLQGKSAGGRLAHRQQNKNLGRSPLAVSSHVIPCRPLPKPGVGVDPTFNSTWVQGVYIEAECCMYINYGRR